MGGKGQRRREKNYKAAHGGGGTRLPPPPKPSSVDALPSKLRKIMSLAGAGKQPFNGARGDAGNGVEKGIPSGEGTKTMSKSMKRKRDDDNLTPQHEEHDDDAHQSSTQDKKKKKKKKSKKANDLRFEKMAEPAAGSQRKERKKQRLEERKKKHKKPRTDDDEEFPGHENIKFGDIVMAPPKLTTVPKAFKAKVDASQERLRLQAVDAYRQRKGWSSRPGIQLPSPVITSPML